MCRLCFHLITPLVGARCLNGVVLLPPGLSDNTLTEDIEVDSEELFVSGLIIIQSIQLQLFRQQIPHVRQGRTLIQAHGTLVAASSILLIRHFQEDLVLAWVGPEDGP